MSLVFLPRIVGANGPGAYATVAVSGVQVKKIALGSGGDFPIKAKNGFCLVEAKSGRVRVAAADCPKKLCVTQGWKKTSGEAIVCLPHRVVVTVEAAGDGDQADAVIQ